MTKSKLKKIIQKIKKEYNGYIDFTINNRKEFLTNDGRGHFMCAMFAAKDNTLVIITDDHVGELVKQSEIPDLDIFFADDTNIMKYRINL